MDSFIFHCIANRMNLVQNGYLAVRSWFTQFVSNASMGGSLNLRGVLAILFFFSHRRISQRAVRTSLDQQLDPLLSHPPPLAKGSSCTLRVSIQVFQKKPIATCDGFPDHLSSLPRSGSAHGFQNTKANDTTTQPPGYKKA